MLARFLFFLFRSAFKITELLLPKLAIKWAARLFMTPGKGPRPEHENGFLDDAEIVEIEVKPFLNDEPEKGRVTVYAWGSGPAVLLVHGWAGRGSQLGAFVPILREHGFRVLSFDGFGHGNSSGKRTNLIDMYRIINEIAIREKNLAAIVGHSFGGYSGAFALHEGVQADGLVTIGSPASLDYVLASFGGQIGASPNTILGLRSYLEEIVGRPADEFSPVEFAPDMTVPLLSIQDKDDKEIDFRQSAELTSSWPNSRSLLTTGLGHRRILNDAEVHRAVVGFVQDRCEGNGKLTESSGATVDFKKAAG